MIKSKKLTLKDKLKIVNAKAKNRANSNEKKRVKR